MVKYFVPMIPGKPSEAVRWERGGNELKG